jgi:hypothetical protein
LLEHCRLDLKYYSSTNTGWLQDRIHELRIAGKQVLARPSLILDVVRERKLRGLWLPDQKRILIDSAQHPMKQRFAKAHEIGHSLIPWHASLLHGDNEHSLAPECHDALEAEANYAASRILFLGQRFRESLNESRASLDHVAELEAEFGNSKTSTLWRLVEHLESPAFGLITPLDASVGEGQGTCPVKHAFQSSAFREQFSKTRREEVHLMVTGTFIRRRGETGLGEIVLPDDNGEEHTFQIETFNNSYDFLTLGLLKVPRRVLSV